MREFLQVLRRFVPPYKKFLALSVFFNILSAVLNIFSFAALIPILQILFQTGDAEAATSVMAWDWGNAQAVLMNNLNYYVNGLIADYGPTTTLLFIGLFLAVTTFLKTGSYFLTSACIVPIRTGVVRDIRNQLYRKITSLPLGFFSEERKGDIIARMSGDVQEVENSIMASLEMLFKNPILLLQSGCKAIVEPNCSIHDQTPVAYAIYQIYRKRYLARYLQECGMQVWVDLNVSHRFAEYNLLGVPEGYNAFFTRGVSGWQPHLELNLEMAQRISGRREPNMYVYGGGKDIEAGTPDNGPCFCHRPAQAALAKFKVTMAVGFVLQRSDFRLHTYRPRDGFLNPFLNNLLQFQQLQIIPI